MTRSYLAVIGLALFATACSESATDPFSPAGDPQFIALHTTIDKPAVGFDVDGSTVTIDWTWSDAEDNWDLVSFKVLRDDVDLGLVIANVKPYTAGVSVAREIIDYGLVEGTYEYCVEVMAKYRSGRGQPETTNHSRDCVEVEVGATPAYSVVMLGGNLADQTQNANAQNWTIGYELYLGATQVMDCGVLPVVTVTPSAEVKQHTCDVVTGARNLVIRNPAKDVAASYQLGFALGGNPIGSFDFATE